MSRGRPGFAVRIATLVLAPAVCLGCATGPDRRSQDQPPGEVALERARQILDESRQLAFRKSEDQDSYRVRLRYNPPRCDAPVFEIRAHGRWTRVWLDGSDEVRDKIDTFRQAKQDADGASRRQTADIAGRITDERRASTGRNYPVFWVETFELSE